jgi:aminopeptidase-like protein
LKLDNQLKSGQELYQLIDRLYPICRSITGNGVRDTLAIISEYIPLIIHEVPSTTKVFDWEIPLEWNIQDAWVKNEKGEKIIDFKTSNLHVLNYSTPIDKQVSLDELKEHLFTLKEHPGWIPYRTSYHHQNWGFCMAYNQFKKLKDERYHVKIDSTLEPGSMTYGEFFIKGKTEDEVLVSTHICHPSLCNDNLSGIAVATALAEELSKMELRYSYRFLFIPGTIGAIAWLSRNEKNTHHIKHGLVLNLLGDSGNFTYKKSRQGDAEIDKIVELVLAEKKTGSRLIDFYPYGYDERQFCSPGFNLPVGRLSRTPHGEFPEYHTSADNMNLISPEKLIDSVRLLKSIFSVIESNAVYTNLNPKCEPQLGKRGLYNPIGGEKETKDFQMALLWVLNFSDGKHSLLQIAEKSGLSFHTILEAAKALVKVDLLRQEI